VKKSPRRQLALSFLLIFGVIAAGTLGYWALENWSFLDSLYMTVITITTIGFKEVHDMSGPGRFFTIFLIFSSVGAVFYSLNNAARILLEGELKDVFGRRKLQSTIKSLRGHYIICGYGRMGRVICKEFAAMGADFLVVEKAPELELTLQRDLLLLQGDATRDEVLREAGIERAQGLVTVLPTDAENLYVVLSARGINPGLTIVTRAVEEGSEQKLLRAGANRVVSPYHIGGLRIAHSVLRPAVADFIEFTTRSGNIDLQMQEVPVLEGSSVAGRTLSESGIGRDLGIIIVAVRKPDGTMKVNPTHRHAISPGETLVVIGEPEKLKLLEEMSGGQRPPR
jgi:voltage-gated potassium channel